MKEKKNEFQKIAADFLLRDLEHRAKEQRPHWFLAAAAAVKRPSVT